MKLNIWKLVTFVSLVLLLSFNNVVSKKAHKQHIRPNVADIIKNIKLEHPLYEKEWRPIEVKSIVETKPAPLNIYDMANAEIVGDQTRSVQKDVNEKPTLYSTVITGRPTSVIHSPEPVSKANIEVPSTVGRMFLDEGARRMHIPVKLAELDRLQEGLEKPVFLHKSQNELPITGGSMKISNKVVQLAQMDANALKKRLKNIKANERKKKLKALKAARKALIKQAKLIRKQFGKNVDLLTESKSTSLSLLKLLKLYSVRIKSQKKLRIGDKVMIQKELKDKFMREIEGFRTAPSQYKELLTLDPKTINDVARKIKKKLNLP